jgi:hypothetical protein
MTSCAACDSENEVGVLHYGETSMKQLRRHFYYHEASFGSLTAFFRNRW